MSISTLNGEILYGSFVSGAREVIKNRNDLNDINVFPVADGDTGNNLASTMNYIIEEAKVSTTAKSTMNSIADAALIGARGNSGIIIAQYINGIFMSLNDKEEITIPEFAESVQNAYPHAYKAISNPVEGTIITVIREWADAVYGQKDIAKNFYELLMYPLEAAFKALEQTTYKLKILEESKVVDSGAKGFVHFIQGFTEFMKTGRIKAAEEDKEKIVFIDHPINHGIKPEYRYCTEALIQGNEIDHDELKVEIGPLGDSLIVAGNSNKSRIHIHTNYPQEVMKILSKKGNILQQKADDMKRQYEAQYERKYNIALVTDSIADVPMEILDLYQINMIPLNLIINSTSYLDKVTMVPEGFYQLLDEMEGYPSSAQPSPKVVESLYASLLEEYDEILAITVAKEQSGTNNIFQKAAEKITREGKRIHVIDSKQNSGAEGLLVVKAAELIHKGLSLDEIIKAVEELRNRTKILVSVNTLKYMVRSGRISKLTGIAGKIVNLKPVVSIDDNGKGKIEDKAFSVNSNTKKIMNIVKNNHSENKITRYAIVHANDPERAEEFKNKCIKILGKDPEYIMNISTIVGMSAGRGCVAVAFMSEKGGQDE